MKPKSSLLHVFSDSFSRWNKRRRDLREIQTIAEPGRGELSALARDIGISSDELLRVAKSGPKTTSELPKLLNVLALEEPRDPRILNDMTTVCGMCMHKRRCNDDLETGKSAQNYTEYCDNAEAISSLLPSKSPQI